MQNVNELLLLHIKIQNKEIYYFLFAALLRAALLGKESLQRVRKECSQPEKYGESS